MKKFLKYLGIIRDMEDDSEFYEDEFHDGLCESIKALSDEEKSAFIYKILEILKDEKNKDFLLQFAIECLEDEITEKSNDNTDYVYNLLRLGLPLFVEIDAQDWEAEENIDYKINDFVEYEIKTDLNFNDYILITKIL